MKDERKGVSHPMGYNSHITDNKLCCLMKSYMMMLAALVFKIGTYLDMVAFSTVATIETL